MSFRMLYVEDHYDLADSFAATFPVNPLRQEYLDRYLPTPSSSENSAREIAMLRDLSVSIDACKAEVLNFATMLYAKNGFSRTTSSFAKVSKPDKILTIELAEDASEHFRPSNDSEPWDCIIVDYWRDKRDQDQLEGESRGRLREFLDIRNYLSPDSQLLIVSHNFPDERGEALRRLCLLHRNCDYVFKGGAEWPGSLIAAFYFGQWRRTIEVERLRTCAAAKDALGASRFKGHPAVEATIDERGVLFGAFLRHDSGDAFADEPIAINANLALLWHEVDRVARERAPLSTELFKARVAVSVLNLR